MNYPKILRVRLDTETYNAILREANLRGGANMSAVAREHIQRSLKVEHKYIPEEITLMAAKKALMQEKNRFSTFDYMITSWRNTRSAKLLKHILKMSQQFSDIPLPRDVKDFVEGHK